MYELNDLLLLLRSSQPVISIQTHEEQRAVDLIKRCSVFLNKPIFQWSITRGMVDAVSGNHVLELADKAANQNPQDLPVSEAKRLIRNAIYDDDAISRCDIDRVQKAKYELLGQDGVLSFEYETASFNQVGGLTALKQWLSIRREAFLADESELTLDRPKGILLVGIQGSGKSLAAKAVAGVWHVPLLRLDFGTLCNKFFGETEKNIRKAL